MKLNEITPKEGSKFARTRVGRGIGSGKGKTSGKGVKGQKARSGVAIKGFEGGQMPLYRRLPKRGFNNKRFAKAFIEINVSDLEKFDDGATVNAEILASAGILSIPKVNDGIKILGNGDLTKKLTVQATAFTASAKAKIEKAGGSVLEV